MSWFRRGLLFLTILISFGLLAGGALAATKAKVGDFSAQQGITEVSANASKEFVKPGETFTVDFTLCDVWDLYGASLDLKFDNTLLEVLDVQPGTVFSDAGLIEDEDYYVTIPWVANDYTDDGNLTLDDVNAGGIINHVVHLAGASAGVDLEWDWQSFVKVTFKVKDAADLEGQLYKIADFNIVSTTPNDFTNGTAVVKLANSSDYVDESGIIDNVIDYYGNNTQVYITDKSLGGIVVDATDYEGSVIDNATVCVYETGTENQVATANTDTNGIYALDLTEGTYDIVISMPGYADDIENEVVVSSTEISVVNGYLFEQLNPGEYRVVVKWDGHIHDYGLDAHMLLPPDSDGYRERVSFDYYGDFGYYPYAKWIGDLQWPVEAITLSQLLDGTYDFSVNDWTEKQFVGFNAHVQVYDSNGLRETFKLSQEDEGIGSWWHVFSLDGIGTNITPIDMVNDEAPYLDYWIELPVDLLEEEEHADGYYTSFDVLIEAENFEWNSLDLTSDVEVWLEGEDEDFEPFSLDVDENGDLIAHFDRVTVGDYEVIAEVKDTEEFAHLFVDSYQGKPVIIKNHEMYAPAGIQYIGLGFDGYHLDTLEAPEVQLVDAAGNVVATSEGTEEWLGVFVDPGHMHFELKVLNGDLPVGTYYWRIIDNDPSSIWDPEVGMRVGPLHVTDGSVIGKIDPWVLGAGLTNYKLKLDGFNLDTLDENNVSISLVSEDNTWNASAVSVSKEIDTNGDFGEGCLIAEFDTPLPNDEDWLRVNVTYDGTSQPVLGSEDRWIEVTDEPVVWGLDPHRVVPNQTSYTFMLHGWNLNQLVDPEADLFGPNHVYIASSNNINVVSDTELQVSFTLNQGLPQGGYNIEIFDLDNEYDEYVGNVWLEVRPDQEPGPMPINIINTAADPLILNFDLGTFVPVNGLWAAVADENGLIMLGQDQPLLVQATNNAVGYSVDLTGYENELIDGGTYKLLVFDGYHDLQDIENRIGLVAEGDFMVQIGVVPVEHLKATLIPRSDVVSSGQEIFVDVVLENAVDLSSASVKVTWNSDLGVELISIDDSDVFAGGQVVKDTTDNSTSYAKSSTTDILNGTGTLATLVFAAPQGIEGQLNITFDEVLPGTDAEFLDAFGMEITDYTLLGTQVDVVSGLTLIGNVTLEGRPDKDYSGITIRVAELDREVTTDVDGNFEIAGLAPATGDETYSLIIDSERYLKERIDGIILNETEQTPIDIELKAGDATEDEKVSLADLFQLAMNFNQFGDFSADFNFDGKVSLGDLFLLAKNFNTVGYQE